MSDFPTPNSNVLPTHTGTTHPEGPWIDSRVAFSSSTDAAVTMVANTATFCPIFLPWNFPLVRFWWKNGSVNTTTNVDCGIYTAGGIRLASTGSVAMGTVAAIQYQVPSGGTIILPPGPYYMAWVCDNTTTRGDAWTITAAQGRILGMYQQATALPLPATATFAQYAYAFGPQLCGITRSASGW